MEDGDERDRASPTTAESMRVALVRYGCTHYTTYEIGALAPSLVDLRR